MTGRSNPLRMGTDRRPRAVRHLGARAAAAAMLALIVAACTVPTGSLDSAGPAGTAGPPASPPSTDPVTPPASPSPPVSPGAEPSAAGDQDPGDPAEAARRLLDEPRLRVEMTVSRATGSPQVTETLVVGDGIVEPVSGRGHIVYDLAGLFAGTGSTASPDPTAKVEVVWSPERLYARFPDRPDDTWLERTRAQARDSGGLVGRLPDEVLGLVTLVVESGRDQLVATEEAQLGGMAARRAAVRVPLEAAVDEGVPADAPHVDVLREAYGIEALDIEVWLVDGAVRRLRYDLARETASDGSPDVTTVSYDWMLAEDDAPIIVPPG